MAEQQGAAAASGNVGQSAERSDSSSKIRDLNRAIEQFDINLGDFSKDVREIKLTLSNIKVSMTFHEKAVDSDHYQEFTKTLERAPHKFQRYNTLFISTKDMADKPSKENELLPTVPQTALSWLCDQKREDVLLSIIDQAYLGIRAGVLEQLERFQNKKSADYYLKNCFVCVIDIEFNQESKHQERIDEIKTTLLEISLSFKNDKQVVECLKNRSALGKEIKDLKSKLIKLDAAGGPKAAEIEAKIKEHEAGLEAIKAELDYVAVKLKNPNADRADLEKKKEELERKHQETEEKLFEERLNAANERNNKTHEKVEVEKALAVSRAKYTAERQNYLELARAHKAEKLELRRELTAYKTETELRYQAIKEFARSDQAFREVIYDKFREETMEALARAWDQAGVYTGTRTYQRVHKILQKLGLA